jgi:hypothetical protein
MRTRFFAIIGILVIGFFFFHGKMQKKLKKKARPVATVEVVSESPVPTISQTPVPESSAASVSPELTAELAIILNELPTTEDIKNLPPEQTHHTPDIIMSAGKNLGGALEKAEQNPERRQGTLQFFLQCAEDENIVPQVRALCWNKLMTKIPEWNLFVPVANAKVGEDIKNLAAQLQ